MTEIRNAFRGPSDPWVPGTQILPLPGDEAAPSTVPETPEEVEDLWAALDARDAALLAN